jgi:hypothetical protein
MADSLMTDKKTEPTVLSNQALEMVMRDVIDSMSDFSLESGFKPSDGGFEIIEIYPAHKENSSLRQNCTEREDSEIIEFPDLRRAAG